MRQSFSPVERQPTTDASAIDWQAVLAQHDRWLRTVVFARLGEPQAVDDVMQEVSLAAVAQRSPLVDAGKVSPWLYRLAVTQSLLYRRKQGRRRRLAEDYGRRLAVTGHPAREYDPLAWLLAEERREMVRLALTRLPTRDAEILLLKYSEDWTYRELADHLGITQTAVQARLHRARQKLRDELGALHVSEDQP
jgi:RNA polymerase sigma-70 factor (ECF subfamily)